jgi:hypothetical protein
MARDVKRPRRSVPLLLSTALALAASGAAAAPPQSWDRVIPDGAKRFRVLAAMDDEAVLDKETGLVWQRAPSSASLFDWGTSTALCIGTAIGGRRGWRLPSAWELMTLKDPAQSNPALPPNHPFQDVVTGTPYWTATAASDDADAAHSLTFTSGGQGIITSAKSNTALRWCVRGPGGDYPGTP